MKAFKIIIGIVIAVPLIFFIVGLLLPTKGHIERNIEIEASDGVVFHLVSDHRQLQRWSPWTELDPNMIVVFTGPEYGVGSAMVWSGNKDVGEGESVFVEVEPNVRAVTALNFGDWGTGQATYELSSEANITTITWKFETTFNNILERYFGLFLEKKLGLAYESGLQSLKVLAEAHPSFATKEETYILDGVKFTGYLAYPVGMLDPVPGVLVVHEWWGHNQYARQRAEMLADLGYTALALDMYGDNKVATHPDDAIKFMQEVGANTELTIARYARAREVLEAHRFTDEARIAAIGYCFGGTVVLNLARQGKYLRGVASFHGGLGGLSPIVEHAFTPMLVLNGGDDPFVTPEQKSQFIAEMDASTLPYEFIDYPGAIHSFTNPDADVFGAKYDLPLAYNAEADADSWQRLEKFLAEVF